MKNAGQLDIVLGMGNGSDPELGEIAGAADRPSYNTAAVEQQTGLRAATFRAWERRYGFPRPSRLPGNQRLYSDRDVAALRWLQRRTDQGLAISQAVRLLQDRLHEGRGAPASVAATQAGRSTAAIAREFGRALAGFDVGASDRLLAEAFALYGVEQACLGVVEPALGEIGAGRRRGNLNTVAEGFATTYVRGKLFALLDAYEPGQPRGRIFTAGAPGESSEIGTLTISLLLARRGFRVDYLGPSLPTDGLADALSDQRPDLLLVWAASVEGASRVREIGRIVAGLQEPSPRLSYAGPGFDDPALRSAIPGAYLGADAGSATRSAEALL